MKRKQFLLGMLVIALTFAMVLVGCPSEPEDTPPPPTSVDDYSSLEPAMAPNPNRAVARAGGTTQIGIPAYLLTSSSIKRAADATATFSVYPDDTDIAEIVSQNGSTCQIKGLELGTARIIVTVGSQSATMLIAVAPSEDFYELPAEEVQTLGESTFYNAWWNSNKPDNLPDDYTGYTSEPTYQIAWNWRNPSTALGASGTNCGIDLLAYYVDPAISNRRGWVRTTYGFGGWQYNLNGVSDAMTNGEQTNGNLKLKLKPEFVYDRGVPYLQITHTLTNTSTTTSLTGQKFGASADVMIFNHDRAGLTHLPYGTLMTNGTTSGTTTILPTIKLRLVCQGLPGIDDVSTLWLGNFGSEHTHVYEDKRDDIADGDMDTALCFSYQNIDLAPNESKTFVIRFTQVQ